MARIPPGVAHGGHNHDAHTRGFFDGAANGVVDVRGLVIAAARNIQHANRVFFAVLDRPIDAATNVVMGNAPDGSCLEKNHLGVRCQTLVSALRKVAIARAHDARHHAVPRTDVGGRARANRRHSGANIVVNEDAVPRFGEVRVRVEARIDKRDRDAAPREVRIGLHAARKGPNIRQSRRWTDTFNGRGRRRRFGGHGHPLETASWGGVELSPHFMQEPWASRPKSEEFLTSSPKYFNGHFVPAGVP